MHRRSARPVLASCSAIALLSAAPALAQDAPAPVAPDAGAPAASAEAIAVTTSAATPVDSKQVFTPADFARFGPRTAWDMVSQIPGFSIRDSDQNRGLGTASGNILFNGARPTNKSEDFFTQLSRIPASSVLRIEIVDGAALDIPGLSGQVANIVIKSAGLKGQFSWTPEFRAHYADPLLTRGEVSVSGKVGLTDYSVALRMNGNRSSAGGPTVLTRADGSILETRDDVWRGNYDGPGFTARFGFDLPGASVANLNLSGNLGWFDYRETSERTRPGGVDRVRLIGEDQYEAAYEIGGDIAFNAAGGQLKLIGLRRYRREEYSQNAVTTLADGTAPFGDIYRADSSLGESILRGEFNWKMLGGDWQLAGEGAFNRLGVVSTVGTLQTGSSFSTEPFAPGTGTVGENRYDGSLSYNRSLSPRLNLQMVIAAEYSTITQGGLGTGSRSFFRPKGSLSLAWKASARFDVSLKLMRRVLQLSLYEFLGRRFIDNGNENAGNAALVPQQDWSLELEANRSFGPWGSTKVRLIAREVQDYVTVVPLPGGGESTGNVAHAQAAAFDWTTTVQFDPLGWKGAKLDLRVLLQHSRLEDPVTGQIRQYSGFTDRIIEASLRHDVPGTSWAWGVSVENYHIQPSFRLSEFGTEFEGPNWASMFIENKDVFGLTVTARFSNWLNARSRWDRFVFDGPRDTGALLFTERRNRLIGPVFRFTVKGNF
jgi:outer membrane receptor for ferrienterochelin and colicins